MLQARHPLRSGSAIAAAVLLLATALRWALHPIIGPRFPFVTYYFAVMLAAWYGGLFPSMSVLALGAPLALALFVPPYGRLAIPDVATLTGLILYLLVGAMAVLISEAHRAIQRRLEREIAGRRKAEAELRASEERLRVTLASIGDAVITTDAEGRVEFLNGVAESLTGWDRASAVGRPVAEVFAIRNERTRAEVESPLTKVLRDGRVVGLANHTILIARDGTERAIDDSGAPIRDRDGRMVGVVMVFRDVTEARRAERTRREQARLLDLAHVLARDLEDRIILWNAGAEQLYGWTRSEALGQPGHALLRTQFPRPFAEIQAELRRQGHWQGELIHTRRDGTRLVVASHWVLHRDEGGAPAAILEVNNDITELKKAQEALAVPARVLESMTEGVSLVTEGGTIVYTNPAEDRMFGYAPGELIGQHVTALNDYPPEQNARIVGQVLAELKAHGVWLGEWRNRKKDGTPFLTYARITALRRDGGTYWVCVQEDITERQQARAREAALRADLQRRVDELQTVLDLVPVGVAIAEDPGCRAIRGNPALAAVLGVPPGANLSLTAPPDQRPPWRALRDGREIPPEALPVQRCAAQAVAVRDEELDVVFDDGRQIRLTISANPLRDAQGRPKGCVGVMIDITERRRAEQTSRFLADASASLAELVDPESTMQRVARLAVPFFADWCVVDLVGDDERVLRAAVAHADSAQEPTVTRLRERYPLDPQGQPLVHQVLTTGRAVLVPEISDALIGAIARDAEHAELIRSLHPRSLICVPLRARNRSLGAMGFVLSDSGRRYGPADLAVSEDLGRRVAIAIENARLYAELKETDRRKDEFLAMLAHELRNPLAPIRNAAFLLRHCGPRPGADQPALLEMIERQVSTLTRLVEDLLDVSRISRGKIELRKQRVELGEIVERAVSSVRSQVEERHHQLSVRLPAGPVRLDADPTRLEQILWNLLNNAAKYTDPGGKIHLAAERDGATVVVRVRDTGVGLDPATLPRIFELFTQIDERRDRAQGGLGIGLSLAKSLVELHGGTITASSPGPGRGSEFVVRLPVLPESTTAPPDGAAAPARDAPAPPRRRLLIVDDNVDAASTLARVLTDCYHQEVRVAHDGPSALQAADADPPDVILLDIGLPGMSGYEVARSIRQRPWSTATKLIAVTGWGQAQDRQRSRQAGFDHHLVKPISLDALRALLDGNHA